MCGDWNGNGKDGIGVVRANRDNEWKWRLRNRATSGPARYKFTFLQRGEGMEYEHDNSSGPADKVFRQGRGRSPVVGDWDGDGRVTVGTYRGSDQMWFLRNRNRSGKARHVFRYGGTNDFANVAGDWDGDGDDTVGVVRSLPAD